MRTPQLSSSRLLSVVVARSYDRPCRKLTASSTPDQYHPPSTVPVPVLVPAPVPVNDLCIPLSAPYSITSLLTSASSASSSPSPSSPSPSSPSSPSLLSEPTLRKLHKLSSLPYPSCTVEEVSDLIGVIEGVRGKGVSELLAELERREKEEGDEQGGEEVGWGRSVVKIDGSGEEQGGEVVTRPQGAEGSEKEPSGRELLELAQRQKGDFYVVNKAQRGNV
jgi:hypothetical protein